MIAGLCGVGGNRRRPCTASCATIELKHPWTETGRASALEWRIVLRAVWLRLALQREEPAGELLIAVAGELGECAVAALLRTRILLYCMQPATAL
jgi:hypothetical protein